MGVTTAINELQDAATKLTDVSGEIANMIQIDGNKFTTQDLNEKVKKIKMEIIAASNVLEENKAVIQECCDFLGLNVGS